ncbi:hypothetical protein DFH27DRAFT_522994 [Peziza echinospora]|nr:hypothetical protein DFH27DRAFT_522994 [Peziza echinospora]
MPSFRRNAAPSPAQRTSPYAAPVVGVAKVLLILTTNLPRLIHGFPTASALPHHREHPSPLNLGKEFPAKPIDGAGFWVYASVAMFLVVAGGLFAGLTLGLMGQDEIYLQVIEASGEGAERIHARRVLRLLQRGKHWVLVTLLLCNVITNETLPIVLDRSLGGGWPAVVTSTILIVIFGEIIPQSVCVRYGLAIGSYLSPFVLGLMYLMYPIGKPTALLLDYILGEDHGTVYKKAGLKTLVTLHKTLGPSPSDRLNQDEVTIISAVLDLKDKPVGSIMTPIEDTFTMSSEDVLDEKTMDAILSAGYSRIPIHAPGEPTNFVGMLLVKILITYDPEDARKVGEFPLATLPETLPETSCLDIVNFFQEGKSHMVLVSSSPGENEGALGVVTLEDVIEELIGEEIIDESDVYIDVHKAIRRIHPSPLARRGISAHYIARGAADSANAAVGIATAIVGIDVLPNNVLEVAHEQDKPDKPASSTNTPKLEAQQPPSVPEDGESRRTSLQIPSDVLAHLKHLGPSNLASNPKKTTSKTIKIKGSVDEALAKSVLAANGTRKLRSDSNASLRPASRGYGSINPDGDAAVDSYPHTQEQSNDDQTPLLSTDTSTDPRSSEAQAKQHNDQVVSLLKHRIARSGSLVESIRTSGGVPKTVIETTSSEEDGEDGSPSSNGKGKENKKGERGSLFRQ